MKIIEYEKFIKMLEILKYWEIGLLFYYIVRFPTPLSEPPPLSLGLTQLDIIETDRVWSLLLRNIKSLWKNLI